MLYSSDVERDWICGVERSSAKMKVWGCDVARAIRSAAAREEVADLVRAMNCCWGSLV